MPFGLWGGEDEEALRVRLLSVGSQSNDIALGLAEFNISPSFHAVLGLHVDQRPPRDRVYTGRLCQDEGTETLGLHLQPLMDDMDWERENSVVPQTLEGPRPPNRQCHCLW